MAMPERRGAMTFQLARFDSTTERVLASTAVNLSLPVVADRWMLTVGVNTGGIRPGRAVSSVEAMNLRLAVLLGLVGLARPVLSVVGAYDSGPLSKPVGPLVLTALVSLVWIVAVVIAEPARPVLTLVAAGLAYGVAAILLNWSLQPFLDSAETIPLPGYFGILIFNAGQGAVLGLIAWLVLRLLRR